MVTLPDEIVFGGARPLQGTVRLPGDKSISHRALLFAALATGTSEVTNIATGADVGATRGALSALGVDIRDDAGGLTVAGAGFGGMHEPVGCSRLREQRHLDAGVVGGAGGPAVPLDSLG